LSGPDVVEDDELIDRLYGAGCNDATFGSRYGTQYAAFTREAPSFGEAVVSAIADIRRADPNLVVG